VSGGRRRVGVLYAPGSAVAIRDIVLGAREVADLVLVLRRSTAQASPELARLAGTLAELAVVADDDVPAGVARLSLDGLTTFHDGELDDCDRALARLGVPGAPGTAAPWDKLVQRERLTAAGVSAVRAVPVDSPRDLLAAAEVTGLPAVLKPRRGTASVGVAILSSAADLQEQVRDRTEWRRLLLEEFMPRGAHPAGAAYLADYISVETVSDAGGHFHFAVFDKLPLSLADPGSPLPFAVRETGDTLPSQLPADQLALVTDATSRALDALGVRSRVSHTECRVGQAGVQVIEVNGRLGGEVARMTRLLGGGDVVAAALGLALGERPRLRPPSGPGYCASVYVPFPRRDGTVQSDVPRARVRALPGVVAVDEVAARGALRAETGFHAAKLVLRAADADDLADRAAFALGQIAHWYAADGVASADWLRAFRAASGHRETAWQ
jgi:biotin carboxylase